MKSKSQFPHLLVALISTAIIFGCETKSVNTKYDIASANYEQLTEQYLQHIANFEWEDSYALLSDDVEFKLPDGDTETRTTFKGLAQVKAFWDSYQQKSGNDKAFFKNFVHVPVQVNEEVDFVGVTGVFDICYFSAELSYGAEKANVRMHWALHFNSDNKIDGIFTYYDRTPIIEAAKKNFLAAKNDNGQNNQVVVQTIKIKSDLSEEELLNTARDRAHQFKDIPGLLQKYYIRFGEPGVYGGVYIWDSKESMQEFSKSALAAGMSKAYQIVEAPKVDISDVIFQLRD